MIIYEVFLNANHTLCANKHLFQKKSTMFKKVNMQLACLHPIRKTYQIKIPFGFLQSNPQILTELVEQIFVSKNMFS